MTRENTVCVALEGGLGNQLFQFATGYSMARRRSAGLRFLPEPGNIHGSSLERFDLPWQEIGEHRRLPAQRKFRHLLTLKSSSGLTLQEIVEPHFHFWEGLSETVDRAGDVLLRGYWQSDRYFRDQSEAVRTAIDIDRFFPDDAPESLKSQRLVAVHVRRGDYVRSPEIRSVHGLQERPYYDRARAVLETLAAPDGYLVFSDEPDAAQELLSGWDRTTFLPRGDQISDLAMMSCCAGWITANSSFSWWGAWLGSTRQPTAGPVIAPRQWFAAASMRRFNTADLQPEGWMLM